MSGKTGFAPSFRTTLTILLTLATLTGLVEFDRWLNDVPNSGPAATEDPADFEIGNEAYLIFAIVIQDLALDHWREDELHRTDCDGKPLPPPIPITTVVVRVSTTGPSPMMQDFANPKRVYDSAPTTDFSVCTDFASRNLRRYSIGDRIRLQVPVVFISDEEIREIFEGGKPLWWDEFYHRYPGSRGFVELSRVGFDPYRRQALVYAGWSCGGLCGQGNMIVLEKRDTGWKVVSKETLWVS